MSRVHGALALVAGSSLTLVGQAPRAYARGEPAFEVSQSVYAYRSASDTETPKGGEADTADSSAFETMPSDLEIQLAKGDWRFSLVPTQPGAAFGVAVEFAKNLEAGLELAITKRDEDTDGGTVVESGYEFSPTFQYTHWFDNDHAIESEIRIGLLKDETSTEPDEDIPGNTLEASKTRESMTEVEVSAYYVHYFDENLGVAAGVAYTVGQGREAEADVALKSSELEVTLLQFRYGLY